MTTTTTSTTQAPEAANESSPPHREDCARRLWELLCWPQGQRYARAFLEGGEPVYPHQPGPLTPDLLRGHLHGHHSLGLLQDTPIGSGPEQRGLCRWGALDLDQPRDARSWEGLLELAAALQQAAADLGLETFSVFSGRKGVHLLLPLVLPMRWGQVQKALRVIGRAVGFTPAELWPTRGKCLKLPLGRHPVTGAWTALLPPLAPMDTDTRHELARALESHLEAAAAGSTQEPDWLLQAARLAQIRPTPVEVVEAAAREGSAPDLELLEAGTHPACISSRLQQGPLTGQTLNAENLLLAAYASSRGLGQAEAEVLATTLWQTAPAGFTKKDLAGALRNFRSSWKAALEGRGGAYTFRCSNAVAGGPQEAKALIACGRCAGAACPCWPWGPSLDIQGQAAQTWEQGVGQTERAVTAPTREQGGNPHGRTFWRALQQVLSEGLEPSLSLVLAAAEQLEPSTEDTWPHPTGADRLAEEETLATILAGGAVLAGRVGLVASAFSCRSTEPFSDWASRVVALPPLPGDVLERHLARLADLATRVEAMSAGSSLRAAAGERETSAVDALDAAALSVARIQRGATPELVAMDGHLEQLVGDLVAEAPPRLPVGHPGLDRVTGGGFRQGQLVVMGGSPGSGKTSLVLQWADDAATAGVPVLFVSMEMSRDQLWLASISRLAGVDSRALGAGLEASSDESQAVLKAVERYRGQIAPNLWLVEGDPARHTLGKLAAMVGAIRHQRGQDRRQPALLVVDYLQLLEPGETGGRELSEPARVAKLATGLKQLARAARCTVVALSDVTKASMDLASSGEEMGAGMFSQSGRILHASDLALACYSGMIPAHPPRPGKNGQMVGGKPAMNHLEKALQEPGISTERLKLLEGARRPFKHPGDTYSRLVVVKNRGGPPGVDVWSLYRRHLSTFQPCLPGEHKEEDLNYGF